MCFGVGTSFVRNVLARDVFVTSGIVNSETVRFYELLPLIFPLAPFASREIVWIFRAASEAAARQTTAAGELEVESGHETLHSRAPIFEPENAQFKTLDFRPLLSYTSVEENLACQRNTIQRFHTRA